MDKPDDDLTYLFTKQFNEMVAGGKNYDEKINRERAKEKKS